MRGPRFPASAGEAQQVRGSTAESANATVAFAGSCDFDSFLPGPFQYSPEAAQPPNTTQQQIYARFVPLHSVGCYFFPFPLYPRTRGAISRLHTGMNPNCACRLRRTDEICWPGRIPESQINLIFLFGIRLLLLLLQLLQLLINLLRSLHSIRRLRVAGVRGARIRSSTGRRRGGWIRCRANRK